MPSRLFWSCGWWCCMTACARSRFIQNWNDRENEISENSCFGKCPWTGDARQVAFQSPNEFQNTWMESSWSPCLAQNGFSSWLLTTKETIVGGSGKTLAFQSFGKLGTVWLWHSIDLLKSNSHHTDERSLVRCSKHGWCLWDCVWCCGSEILGPSDEAS